MLALRFAALQKYNENLVDDLKSDYCDVDDENSCPKGNDPIIFHALTLGEIFSRKL